MIVIFKNERNIQYSNFNGVPTSAMYVASPFTVYSIVGVPILTVTSILGIIGNIHVISVYVKYYKKNNFRLYVIVLSTVDLIGCCVIIPRNILHFCSFHLGRRSYTMYPLDCIQSSIVMMSMSVIVVIGVDRARRVMKPLGTQITYTEAKLTCALICAVVLVINIFLYVTCFVMSYDSFKDNSINYTVHVAHWIYGCCLSSIVVACLVVYTTMGIHLCCKLNKFGRFTRTPNVKLPSDSSLKTIITDIDRIRATSYRKGARKTFVFFIVALASCLCVIPLTIYVIIHDAMSYTLGEYVSHDQICSVWEIVFILSCVKYVNHCINPIVYGLLDSNFRQKCVMLHKHCKGSSL